LSFLKQKQKKIQEERNQRMKKRGFSEKIRRRDIKELRRGGLVKKSGGEILMNQEEGV